MQNQKFTIRLNGKINSPWLAAGFLALFVASAAAGEDHPPGSYQTMDYGPVIGETIVAGWPEHNVAHKGLAVRLDHNSAMIFDTDLMRWSVAATGGWIDLGKSSHTSYKGSRPPHVEGREIFATSPSPGWAHGDVLDDPRPDQRGNLSREWALWRGFYRDGDRVILSYTVADVEILESPSAVKVNDSVVFVRSIRTSGSEGPMIAYVAQARQEASVATRDGSIFVGDEEGVLGFRIESNLEDVKLRLGDKDRIEMIIPPHAGPGDIRLFTWEEKNDTGLTAAWDEVVRQTEIDFTAVEKGGAARWTTEIETSVQIADDEAAYVTDRIGLPFENPWDSWIRPSAFDFFADGDRAALSTWNGDIWIVSGLSDDRVRWRRFASGLYYPMGVVVVDEKIHVTERRQLTRLHDLNGDGEADFYESVNNAGILHPMAHSLCLEVDSEGNFYFFKNGNRVPDSVPGHGALVRVSADGSKREVFASGIRGANALGIGPGDMIFGADQQGDWIPTARVDWLREGGFYGYRRHNPTGRPEGDFDAPVCWIPHRVDNSSGAMAYAGDERWGPMAGNWLIGSYGQCTLFALLVEEKGNQLQGGVVKFPLDFASGLMRARVNPADGQVYLLGMKGWQTTGTADGSFDRVRYTGRPNRMPVGLGVEPGIVRIDFSDALDPESVKAENFEVERWQYVYSARYGSPEMSVANPEEKGRDPVAVSSARLSEDGRSVLIEIPDLKPVMQQSVAYRLRFADGGVAENTIYHTIHRLSDQDEAIAVASSSSAEAEEPGEEGESQEDEAEWAAYAPGREIFENTCSVCHQPAGRQGIAPALSESRWAGGNSAALVRIVLQGKIGEQGTMMPFSWLSDDDISSLLSYIRVRWHGEEPIAAEDVKAIREATKDRSQLWTAEELQEF